MRTAGMFAMRNAGTKHTLWILKQQPLARSKHTSMCRERSQELPVAKLATKSWDYMPCMMLRHCLAEGMPAGLSAVLADILQPREYVQVKLGSEKKGLVVLYGVQHEGSLLDVVMANRIQDEDQLKVG